MLVSEVIIDEILIFFYCGGFVKVFGVVQCDDFVYQVVSEGVWLAGVEYWLFLFYLEVVMVFFYFLEVVLIGIDVLVYEVFDECVVQVKDYFDVCQFVAEVLYSFSLFVLIYCVLEFDVLYLI